MSQPAITIPNDDLRPIAVTLLLSLLIHLLLLGFTTTSEEVNPLVDTTDPPDRERETVIRPGEAKPSTAKVAWIAHDAYQQLMAHQSPTIQPALQTTAEPTPDAAPDPLPTAPEPAAVSAQPSPPTTSQPAPDTPEKQQLQELDPGQTLPKTVVTPTQEPTPPQPPEQPAAAITAEDPGPENPTSAERDTREAPPTSIEGQLTVQPGKVVAQQGIRIETVLPRFTVAARATIPQRNPIVMITFDTDGTVSHVDWIRTSGLAIHDSPIERSLYRWTASGPFLERAKAPIKVEMKILLLHEREKEDESE